MKQITHNPFLPEAVELGRHHMKLSRHAACLKRWSEFFLEVAQEKQAAYESTRKQWLLEEAKSKPSPRKKKPTPKALAALMKAGLPEAEARRILSL